METFADGYTICPHCGYAVGTLAEEAIHMNPGTLLHDRYVVGKVLGYGGFGTTYIGWDGKLEQKVAIKEYLPGEFSTRMPGQTQVTIFNGDKSEQFRDGMKKFVEEAKHLAKFQNEPGIVKIFDSFEENDTAYIVMEYLDGMTMTDYLKQVGTIPEDDAVAMLMPVMTSLETVHAEGLLHRDIAPDNIFITKEGDIKLIDFGASRYATTSHSRSLTVIIKPGYSPEEQYRSRGDQGPYTDVYALSATLYKMITGKTPPDAMERRAKYENQNKDILVPPHKLMKGLSVRRENAILNAMNVRIEDRTPDVETFIQELNAEKPAKRIYGKIKKLDLYAWPLWLKISVPAVLTAVIAFGVLIFTGVIDFNRYSTEIVVPDYIVSTPEVEGLNKDEAIRLIETAGLLASTGGTIDSEYIGAGKVILQTPVGGTFTEKNSTMKLTLSAGKGAEAPVDGISTVPYVIANTLEDAKIILRSAGLASPEIDEAYDDIVEEGCVISTSVEAGQKVAEGTKIKLTVSRGPASFGMPDVSGMKEDEARKALEAKGLIVSQEYDKDNNVPEGCVIRQDLPAGTEVRKGDSVLITICSGKKTVMVADVAGMTKEEAEEALKKQNLKVAFVENYDNDIEEGKIIKQTPEANTSQIEGSTITVYISKGPQLFTLKLDAAGGTVSTASVDVYYGRKIGDLPTPTRDGYNFKGWYTAKSGGTAIDPNYEVTAAGTIYAQWVEKPVELTSISIKTKPSKTSYFTGDSLNSSGLVLTAAYSNGTSKEITSGFTCSPTALNTAGNQSITISFGGKTANFTVSVQAVTLSSLSIKSNPTRTSYYVGESLDTAGLALTAKYTNGNSQTVTSGFTCSPTSFSKAGNQTVTVSFSGKSVTFTVKVESVDLTSISIKTKPTRLNYYTGETLNTAGLVLTAKYSNGTSKDITSGFTCSPTALNTAGNQTINVSFNGKSTTFTVKVESVELTGISVKSKPSKLSYYTGETLNTSGLVLTASYSNGTNKEITSGFTCSPTELNSAGEQKITVTYNGKTASFNVSVTAVTLTGISIASNPSKTSYYIGDALNTSGLSLKLTYNNGRTETISSGFTASADLSSAGTKTVTVSYGGQSVSYSITVNTPSISLNYSSYSLALGHSLTVSASTQPSGQSISWSTSNSSISVSSGTITAKGHGISSTITASFSYNGKTYSAKMSVSVPTPSVSLSSTSGSATRSVHGSTYTISGKLAFEICDVPSIKLNTSNMGNGGNSSVSTSNLSYSWDSGDGYSIAHGGVMYGFQVGSTTRYVEVYYNGYYVAKLAFTTKLALTFNSSSQGNYIRSDHSTSASKLGTINAGNNNISASQVWCSGTPGQSGVAIWVKVTWNGVTGWCQACHW